MPFAHLTFHRSDPIQSNPIQSNPTPHPNPPARPDIVYGPLVNGTTTVLFESVPTYPNHCRYWDLIQRHKVTQFYTAPTAIRALMRFGTEDIATFDRSTLRVLGSVGEPINPEAWKVRKGRRRRRKEGGKEGRVGMGRTDLS